jgi:hypothetical protein
MRKTQSHDTQIHPDLVDRLLELYCDWRTECAEVQAAYSRFSSAPASHRELAFASYTAALDREGLAADIYGAQIRLIQSRHAFRSHHRERADRQAERDWAQLIEVVSDLTAAIKAERAAGTEATDPRMLELARQWRALIDRFTVRGGEIRDPLLEEDAA